MTKKNVRSKKKIDGTDDIRKYLSGYFRKGGGGGVGGGGGGWGLGGGGGGRGEGGGERERLKQEEEEEEVHIVSSVIPLCHVLVAAAAGQRCMPATRRNTVFQRVVTPCL